MNRLIACTLALLLVLLTPASANSAPTRLGGTGGSALTVDEGCPVTVTAEQLTFDVSGAGDSNGLTAQVEAVYQMENPTENPLSVQMSFYLEEHRGHMDSLVDVDSAVSSITADGQSLPFTIQEVETEDAAVDRFALTYTVEFPAWGTREVAVAYLSSSYGLREGTTYWTQEFTYLLSPARHWAEFGSLDITIRTPEPAPYIVRSSLPLREAEERCYTAHFDSLPDGELTFTLYPRHPGRPASRRADLLSVHLRVFPSHSASDSPGASGPLDLPASAPEPSSALTLLHHRAASPLQPAGPGCGEAQAEQICAAGLRLKEGAGVPIQSPGLGGLDHHRKGTGLFHAAQ